MIERLEQYDAFAERRRIEAERIATLANQNDEGADDQNVTIPAPISMAAGR